MYPRSPLKQLALISDQTAIDDAQIVLGFNISSDSKYLLTYTDNGNVNLFDISALQKIAPLETDSSQLNNYIWSIVDHDEQHPPQIIFPIAGQGLPKMLIVIYTRTDTIEFWDPLANNRYFTIPSNNSSVRQFHFTAAYSKILVVTENDLSIFDLISKTKTNLSISEPALKNCSIQTCHFSSDEKNLLITFHDSPLHTIYFARNVNRIWSLDPIERIALDSPVLSCQQSPRRDKLLIVAKGTIRICQNNPPFCPTISIIQHQFFAQYYLFNADETILIVGEKKIIQVFLTATGHCCFTIQKMENIQSIDCSPNNPIFSVMLESGHVDIHCLRTGNFLTSIRDPDLAQGGMSGVCAKFSPDGFSIFTLLDVMSCIKCWSIGLTPFIGLGNIITITRNRQRAIGPKSRVVPEIENLSKIPRIR